MDILKKGFDKNQNKATFLKKITNFLLNQGISIEEYTIDYKDVIKHTLFLVSINKTVNSHELAIRFNGNDLVNSHVIVFICKNTYKNYSKHCISYVFKEKDDVNFYLLHAISGLSACEAYEEYDKSLNSNNRSKGDILTKALINNERDNYKILWPNIVYNTSKGEFQCSYHSLSLMINDNTPSSLILKNLSNSKYNFISYKVTMSFEFKIRDDYQVLDKYSIDKVVSFLEKSLFSKYEKLKNEGKEYFHELVLLYNSRLLFLNQEVNVYNTSSIVNSAQSLSFYSTDKYSKPTNIINLNESISDSLNINMKINHSFKLNLNLSFQNMMFDNEYNENNTDTDSQLYIIGKGVLIGINKFGFLRIESGGLVREYNQGRIWRINTESTLDSIDNYLEKVDSYFNSQVKGFNSNKSYIENSILTEMRSDFHNQLSTSHTNRSENPKKVVLYKEEKKDKEMNSIKKIYRNSLYYSSIFGIFLLSIMINNKLK